MTLSVWLITRDSGSYVERMLRSVRTFADDFVIGVDTRSVDATAEVCRPYADQLFFLEPFGDCPELPFAWMIEQCRGDWILVLDDDELPSVGLVRALPRLMADDSTTHYWFRRCWLDGPEGTRWLSDPIWWPDWQLRLMRNRPESIYVADEVHSVFAVGGDSRYVPQGTIYHLDHVLHSPQKRLAKAQRYERLDPGNANWDQYVVPPGPLPATQPLPPDDPPAEGPRAIPCAAASIAPGRTVRLDELRQALGRSRWPTVPPVTLAPPLAASPELFRAELVCLDEISTMAAGQPLWLTLRVRNESPVVWGRPGSGHSQLRVTCHWLGPDGAMDWFDAGRSQLSCSIQPSTTEIVPIWVLAPNKPGYYQLKWELVLENVGWFSQQGWRGPDRPVRVYRAATPLSERQARKFARFFGVEATAVDGPPRAPIGSDIGGTPAL